MKKDDPVVERVRAARKWILDSGGDEHRLYEWARQIEAQQRHRLVGYNRSDKPTRGDRRGSQDRAE